MSVNFQVHKLVELRGRRGMKVVDYSNPAAYIRIACKEGTVFIQNGKIMYEDGDKIELKNIPEWLLTEIKKCDPERLREAGFAVGPILDELEAAKKAKSNVRLEAKREAAKAAAKAAAKKANKGGRQAKVADPEPEDVGLTEETEEETQE